MAMSEGQAKLIMTDCELRKQNMRFWDAKVLGIFRTEKCSSITCTHWMLKIVSKSPEFFTKYLTRLRYQRTKEAEERIRQEQAKQLLEFTKDWEYPVDSPSKVIQPLITKISWAGKRKVLNKAALSFLRTLTDLKMIKLSYILKWSHT